MVQRKNIMSSSKYAILSRGLELIYRVENAFRNNENFDETLGIALDMIMEEARAESGTIWIEAEGGSYLSPYIIKGEKVDELNL